MQQGLEQFALHIKHLECGAAAALATHLGTLAHSAHNHVGILGYGQCLALQQFAILERGGAIKTTILLQRRVAGKVAALGIAHGGLTCQRLLHSLFQGDVLAVVGCRCPGASHVGTVVGHRTDKGYLALFLEW